LWKKERKKERKMQVYMCACEFKKKEVYQSVQLIKPQLIVDQSRCSPLPQTYMDL